MRAIVGVQRSSRAARSRCSARRPATGRCAAGSATSPRRPRLRRPDVAREPALLRRGARRRRRRTSSASWRASASPSRPTAVVGRLSGGQRSAGLARDRLLGRPELLVLDEPTVGLDPVLRRDLWETVPRPGRRRGHAARLQPRDGRGGALRPAAAHARRRGCSPTTPRTGCSRRPAPTTSRGLPRARRGRRRHEPADHPGRSRAPGPARSCAATRGPSRCCWSCRAADRPAGLDATTEADVFDQLGRAAARRSSRSS